MRSNLYVHVTGKLESGEAVDECTEGCAGAMIAAAQPLADDPVRAKAIIGLFGEVPPALMVAAMGCIRRTVGWRMFAKMALKALRMGWREETESDGGES